MITEIPAEIAGLRYTRVQRHIIEILSDGEPHEGADLLTWDKFADETSLNTHIYQLRKMLDRSRYRIYRGVEGNTTAYRLVVLMASVSSQ